MTIEELNALDKRLSLLNWDNDWDCQTVANLISAEIERQSVGDGDVQDVIEFIACEKRFMNSQKNNIYWDLAIDALRAYRKPENHRDVIIRMMKEKLQNTTKDERLANLDKLKNREWKLWPEVYQGVAEELGLVKPVEPEPCEWCSLEGLPDESVVGPHDFFVWSGSLWHYDTEFGWEGAMINYCPNCGREMTKREKND